MKTVVILAMFCLQWINMVAQVPQAFKYQAVARNAAGVILVNQTVSFRVSIIQGTVTGAIVYTETHKKNTNSFGLVDLEIGKGTPVSGVFSNINWGNDAYYVNIEMDPSGGSAYQFLGASQLLSVPYALDAKKVEIGDNWGTQGVTTDETLSGNGTLTSPLKISQQAASVGQVLKWSGTIWRPGADLFGGSLWTQNGSDIYYDAGKVGVGTNAPNGILELKGNSTVHHPQLSIVESENDFARVIFKTGPWAPSQSHWSIEGRVDESTPENSNLNFSYYNGWVDQGMTMMSFDRWGNVGLGTTKPKACLDIQRDGVFIHSGADIGSMLRISDGFTELNIGGGDPLNGNSNIIAFTSADLKSKLAINMSTGYIGIGTPKPEAFLNILGNSSTTLPQLLLSESEGDYARLTFKNAAANTKNWSIAARPDPTDANSLFNFWYWNGSTGTNIMTITGNGNVGIGAIAPENKLDIAGILNLNKGLTGTALRCNGAEAMWFDGNYFSWGFGGTYNYFSDPVTIGTAGAPGYNLVVNGTAAKTGGGSWTNLSDSRLKDLKGKYTRGLQEIMSLEPVKFNYLKGNPRGLASDEEQIGFVAQDVRKIFPEAVTEAKDGYLDFNMHAVNVAMVNAIKELKAENDQLKLVNEDLKAKDIEIISRIEKLEKLVGVSAQK
jgi:hypothetical protein